MIIVMSRCVLGRIITCIALLFLQLPIAAAGLEFRSIALSAAIGYDAPSQHAQRIYVTSAGYPVEVVVSLDAWVKVRDAAGDVFWVERKSLGDKRSVIVTAERADVRSAPDDKAAPVFQAERGVSLELVEYSGTLWVKVRHPDGETGFVRIVHIWGV
ncbi:MAG: SH3 domain-containing protein [Burkholderiales bacterium]